MLSSNNRKDNKESIMKLKAMTAALTVMTGFSAYAASDFVDTAQVISATPIIERVSEPRQECDTVAAPKKEANILAPIIGGVLGGLLGHQVGQGSGKTAATIVGATGGAVAGTMAGNRAGAQPTQRCRTVESTREIVNGYDVVYRYNGRDVNVALPYNPGSTIKVAVGVVLDERSAEYDRAPQRGASYGAQPAVTGEPAMATNNAGYTYRY
jgi:uncharacterized protein YcfJ